MVVLLLAGCGRRAAPPVPESGGTVRIAVFHPLDSPAPVAALDPTTTQLLEHVLPPLGRIDEIGNAKVYLARQIIDTGGSVEFTLRHVRWDDGQPVTPADFVLAATLLADPKGGERARVELLRAATAVNDSTLRLEYLTMYGRRLRHSLLAPVPSHLWTATQEPARWAPRLACGPYKVVGSAGDRLALVRNDVSGFPPARLDSVQVEVMSPDEAVRRFLHGSIDAIEDLPVTLVEKVRHHANVVALVGRSYVFMGWNLHDARFGMPVVRRAAAQAVDMQRILHDWTLGFGDPSRGPLVPAQAFADTNSVLPYDPAAAARALEAAGWIDSDRDGVRDRNGARLAFHLLVPDGDPLRAGIARCVSDDLKRVGIAAEVRMLSTRELLQRLQSRSFEAFMGQWYPDPGLDLDPVWRSDSGDRHNYVGYESPVADSLLTRMWHERSDEERADVLAHFQARVYADQPYLFLVEQPHFLVLARRIRGAEPNVISPYWNLPQWWIPRGERQR